MLSKAARLWPLVAEGGRRVPCLEGHLRTMLDEGANDRRRALGTKGQRSPALVLEFVHLFCDDVGFLADAVAKYPDVFEHRTHHQTKAGARCELGEGRDH